jgi:hypothetical protein
MILLAARYWIVVEHDAAAPQSNVTALRHEQSGVNAAAVALLGLALAVIVASALVLLVWIFNRFSVRETRTGHNVRRAPTAIVLPPEPNLQVSPRSDLEELLAAEQKQLDSYGWVDKDKGIVRIPIERAMELIAKRGLPAQKK